MIRNWLRQWLGVPSMVPFADGLAKLEVRISAMEPDLKSWKWAILEDDKHNKAQFEKLEERSTLAWERINAIEVEHSALSKKQAELSAILQEVRQLREMLADPKRQPIATRTTHQFRALMEQE